MTGELEIVIYTGKGIGSPSLILLTRRFTHLRIYWTNKFIYWTTIKHRTESRNGMRNHFIIDESVGTNLCKEAIWLIAEDITSISTAEYQIINFDSYQTQGYACQGYETIFSGCIP